MVSVYSKGKRVGFVFLFLIIKKDYKNNDVTFMISSLFILFGSGFYQTVTFLKYTSFCIYICMYLVVDLIKPFILKIDSFLLYLFISFLLINVHAMWWEYVMPQINEALACSGVVW